MSEQPEPQTTADDLASKTEDLVLEYDSSYQLQLPNIHSLRDGSTQLKHRFLCPPIC